jgi:hypothetical protein
MKEEKHEKQKEKNDIRVVDSGMDVDNAVNPIYICCWGPYAPIRFF